MGDDSEHRDPADMEEKTHHSRPMTNSSTEAELDEDNQPYSKEARSIPHHDGTDFVGTPDIDHDEIEEAVPGHELDVELAKVSQTSNISWLSDLHGPQSWQP